MRGHAIVTNVLGKAVDGGVGGGIDGAVDGYKVKRVGLTAEEDRHQLCEQLCQCTTVPGHHVA